VLSVLLRLGRLALVTYLVGMGTWTLLGPDPIARSTAVVASRAAAIPRGAVLGMEAAPLTVSVDGLVANVRSAEADPVAQLRGEGLAGGRGQVDDDDAGAARVQSTGRGLAEAGGTAGDESHRGCVDLQGSSPR
jgi:hypothetical protein